MPRAPGQNALLAAIPAEELSIIQPRLERVELKLKQVLSEAGEPLTHVWFPRLGVISMVSELEDGAVVELATIGREGMIGVPLLLESSQTPQKLLCQIPGEADRVSAQVMTRLLVELPHLRRLLSRYALSLFAQVAQGVSCNRLHAIEARCARWLLMTHDRVDGDSFPLTHEFLGQMLGVTRPSVSIAAGMLQKAGFIRYVRGNIHILDRDGLEGAACECYGVITGEFRRLVDGAPR